MLGKKKYNPYVIVTDAIYKKPKNNHLIQDHQQHHHLRQHPRANSIPKNYDLTKKSERIRNDRILITNTSSQSQSSRIMIVDDEQDIARLFAISLENNGFVVDVFNDPLSALSNYKAGLYDLLLLDIRMPDMNGFELYEKIKDIDDKAKVCFITAYDESQNDYKKVFPSL